MHNIFVGVDGSTGADHALRWAVGLAERVAVQPLVVATVYVAIPDEVVDWRTSHDRALERLERWCGPVRDAGLAYKAIVVDGECGPALLAAADDYDAVLTVVSRRGNGPVESVVVGSAADYLAHHIRRPLAVVPTGYEGPAPSRLLVATDGSEDGTAAVEWAVELSQRLETKLSFVHVVLPADVFLPLSESRRRLAEEALSAEWTEPARRAGVNFDWTILENRHPADALLRHAEEMGSDIIIAGTRSLGGLRRIRLGGVTMQLLHHASLPVVVVPSGWDPR